MSPSYKRYRSIFKHWSERKAARFCASDTCSDYELKKKARYLGIPAAQLRWVSRFRPDPVSLLERRMGSLSLTPDEIAHIEPGVIKTLRQRCARCVDLERCAMDLADKFADPGSQCWQDYCPNAATLTMLSDLQSCGQISESSR
jgi:hypothetical protein